MSQLFAFCRPITSASLRILSSLRIAIQKIRGERGSLFSPLKEFIRKRVVKFCLSVLSKHGQKELEHACKNMAVEIGVQLSVRGVQAILDKEGIRHCFACTERFGIRKINDIYACPRCVRLLEEKKADLAKAS